MSRYHALVPAAGVGSRMGAGVPKQYLPLAGHTVLWHALNALHRTPRIEHVWVVLGEHDEHFDRYDWSAFTGGLTPLRCGGPSRAASVLAGLQAIAAHVDARDWILVHDAARPCVTVEMIDRLIDEVGEDDAGGILAVPISDTVKRADARQHIAQTVPRDALWAAQTPQMFRHAALLQALLQADPERVTDEAGAMEAVGANPRLVMGSVTNVKVTRAEDLHLAAKLLTGISPV